MTRALSLDLRAQRVAVLDLGRIGYQEALEAQHGVLDKRINGNTPDTIIFLEHYPVVTLGRLSTEDSILDRNYIKEHNIPVIHTSRGGKITYHGPGQLVIYPVIDISARNKDVSAHIDLLERAVSKGLNRLGIPACRLNNIRGVWVEERKIAFTGVSFKRWVSYHGIAININNDTSPFSAIDPCGEKDIKVTSAKEILGKELDMDRVKQVFAEEFTKELRA